MTNLPNREKLKEVADDWFAKGVAYILVCVKCSRKDDHVRLEYLYNTKDEPVGYECPCCGSEWIWEKR